MTENYTPPLPPTTISDPLDETGPVTTAGYPGAVSTPAATGTPATTGTSAGTSGADTKEVAKGQAAQVGQGAAEAGQHVAGVAKEQGAQVAREASQQAKELAAQAQGQLKEQAGAQQEKLVGGLKSIGSQLSALADGNAQPGMAADLAREAADRSHALAGWLDGREPGDVLNEVTRFARRRPGAFLAAAAGVGFLAGRLTRGLQAQASGGSSTSAGSSTPGAVTPEVTGGPAYTQAPALPPVAGYGDPALDAPLVPPVAAPGPGYLGETR